MIDFVIYFQHQEIPPKVGAVGFLQNYQLFKQNNSSKLNSTYRSYFREEVSFQDDLTKEFRKVME